MTAQPSAVRTVAELATYLQRRRKEIDAKHSGKLTQARTVLDNARALFDSALAAYTEVEKVVDRDRLVDLGGLVEIATELATEIAAAPSSTSAESAASTDVAGPTGAGARPGSDGLIPVGTTDVIPARAESSAESSPVGSSLPSLSGDVDAAVDAPAGLRDPEVRQEVATPSANSVAAPTGENAAPLDQVGEAASPASALGVAPAEVTTGQPSTSAASETAAPTAVLGDDRPIASGATGVVPDGESTGRPSSEPGPKFASDAGVRKPKNGDKVRLCAGGIGEIVDTMMGIARVKDGPTLKYSMLMLASGGEVQWSEKLEGLPATPPVATPPVAEATQAPAGKERRKCDRCGTEALVLANGQLRGHLTPDKRRCKDPAERDGELAHEMGGKKKAAAEPEGDVWPSPKTGVDDKAGELF